MTSLRTILIILTLATATLAADIQYDLATGDVTGVSDATIPAVPGHGVVSIPEAASAIQWPHPAGCAAADINPNWVRLTEPGSVDVTGAGMALRPEVEPFLFTTTSPLLPGCHFVGRWGELRSLVRQTIVANVPDQSIVEALNYHFGWYTARCGDAPTNQNCIDWKVHLDSLGTLYPSRVQGITASSEAVMLLNDATAFKNARCTANPGGPFC